MTNFDGFIRATEIGPELEPVSIDEDPVRRFVADTLAFSEIEVVLVDQVRAMVCEKFTTGELSLYQAMRAAMELGLV